jgi:hypothetical protein
MVAIIAWNQARRFARERICADDSCAARTVLAQGLGLAGIIDLELSWLALGDFYLNRSVPADDELT